MDRPITNDTPLDHSAAGHDPFALFESWFSAAKQVDPNNAAVTALATTSPNGRPSLRMVLLKEHGPDGFVFYTNYESRKETDLSKNPFAAMTFWWPVAERQVRIEGPSEKICAADSDAYFSTRPRDSQLSAWASTQSRAINAPVTLDEAQKQFEDRDIPRPDCWGGYRLLPETFEFWQGRTSRLHDRLLYTKENETWRIDRLAP